MDRGLQDVVAAAQAQHQPWLRDGIYPLLPYSAIILENTACECRVDGHLD